MARYLIPKPIQRQYELFPGWGWVQIGLVAVGLLLGVLFFAVLTLLRLAPVPVRMILLVVPGGMGGFLAFPPPNDQPLYQRLLAGLRFAKRPRRWLYDWNTPDWPHD